MFCLDVFKERLRTTRFSRYFVLGCALFAGSHQALAEGSSNWNAIYTSSLRSIPVLQHDGGLCAGALVAPDRILTAAHCVASLREVAIRWRDTEQTSMGHVVFSDTARDVAVVRLDAPSTRPVLRIVESNVGLQPGDEVATIGHPFGISSFSSNGLDSNLNFVMSRGIISKINPDNIIADLSLSPGNSGGPVFNWNGEIVGLASRKITKFGSGSVGFLVPPQHIRQALAESVPAKTLPFWRAEGFPILEVGLFSEEKLRSKDAFDGYEMRLGYSLFSRVGVVFGLNTANFGRALRGQSIMLNDDVYRYRYFEVSAGEVVAYLTPVFPVKGAVTLQWRSSGIPGQAWERSLFIGARLAVGSGFSVGIGCDTVRPKSMFATVGVNLLLVRI